MKKGVYITLTVFVEGEDEPANDFYKLAASALVWSLSKIAVFPDKIGLSLKIIKMFEDPQETEEV
jgi:hypothetical protein